MQCISQMKTEFRIFFQMSQDLRHYEYLDHTKQYDMRQLLGETLTDLITDSNTPLHSLELRFEGFDIYVRRRFNDISLQCFRKEV